jgi:hypothetical protein
MAKGRGRPDDPTDMVVKVAPGEAIAAPDEYMKCLGEVGNYFASLDRLVEQFIHALDGKVADRRWGFRRKCRTIRTLLKLTGNEAYATDVGRWLGDCEEAAEERNEAIHAPHARLSRGWLQIGEDGKKTEQLAALKALKAGIIALHSRGTVYKDELPEVIERMAQETR